MGKVNEHTMKLAVDVLNAKMTGFQQGSNLRAAKICLSGHLCIAANWLGPGGWSGVATVHRSREDL